MNNRKLNTNQLNRANIDTYKKSDKAPIILILDNVRSAINVGSIFRTADAFKIEKIYLCGITSIPPNKELLKSALGATESVAWEYYSSTSVLVNELKTHPDNKIICLEQTLRSDSLHQFFPKQGQKNIFILGNEIEGVDQNIIDMADQCIEIPQFGTKHSLNVAVTAGIVLWDVFAKIHFVEPPLK